MRVKIGDTIYDPQVVPIIIQLTPEDKCVIASLPRANDIWCKHPTGYPQEELKKFMGSMPPHPAPSQPGDPKPGTGEPVRKGAPLGPLDGIRDDRLPRAAQGPKISVFKRDEEALIAEEVPPPVDEAHPRE